jgi:5'-phosphate synthase pdxT subunit
MQTIGVLGLQGGYKAHAQMLEALGHKTLEVRNPDEFASLAGLILPGGESTTQLKLIDRFNLKPEIDALIEAGKPVFATCAGMILCAKNVTQPEQPSYGYIDIDVERNGWGRQLDSFEAKADGTDLELCFIRAPRITRIGKDVEVLATFNGEPVMVRQNNVTAATFHPELTEDSRVHAAIFGNTGGDIIELFPRPARSA